MEGDRVIRSAETVEQGIRAPGTRTVAAREAQAPVAQRRGIDAAIKSDQQTFSTQAGQVSGAAVPRTAQIPLAMMVPSRPSTCDPNSLPTAKTSFLSTDPQAILWFVITGAQFGDLVVADFLTPAGPVYATATANWAPLSGTGDYCFTSHSLMIAGTDVATQIGRWTARVRINGTMYASVPFNILANECTYSLSSMSQTMGAGGGSGSVGVTVVGSGCAAWTATSNVSWITVQSGASGFSSGTVSYSVAPNPIATPRTGVLAIAGQNLTVTQAGVCPYSLSLVSQSLGSGGGNGTVSVSTTSGCVWTAASNVSWITVQSGASGSGYGTVSYSVAANTGATSRSGTLTIGGQTFTVIQAGACTYSLNPASQSLGSGGGNGTLSVTTASGCAWTAASNASWIAIQSGASGTGSGTVTYTVVANTTTSSRTATLTIAGQTFTVTQAAGPQLVLSMMTRNKPATCDSNNPPAAETNFLSTDTQAILWFYVANVQAGDAAASEYYAPSGQLYTPASGPWDPASTAGYKCFTDAPMKIAGDQPASMPGTWTVKVKFNGQPLFTLTFNIAPAPITTRPTIRPGGVTSASGFGGMATIAPGTWIEILGSNLSTTTRTWAGGDFNGQNAPNSLDGVSVTVSSRPAFLSYISPTQVNALVPSDIGTGTMQIVVASANGASDAYAITANAVQPGLLAPPAFLVNGRQYVAALFPDSQFALPVGLIPGVASRPARPGETVVLYAIGCGSVKPGIPAGTIVSSPNSLTASLEMTIGSAPASIPFAGLAQGFVGLYQINVVVPNVPDSDAVPLTFTLDGVPGSATLYIAVRQGVN